MKIAIFTNNYLPNPFGVAGSIESFRKEFEKLGHTVYIFAPKTKGYIDQNPNVFRFPSIDFKYKISFPLAFPFSYCIDGILENLEIDVVHSQHPNLLGWQARRWAKKKNVPLIFTWHTLYDRYAHFVPLVPSSWAAFWAIGNAVSYANDCAQVIVPTNSVVEIVREWGVRNSYLAAIPTGVEEEFFRDSKRYAMREKFGIAKDEIALLLLCRLTAEKNVEFLVRAVVGILKRHKKTKFILAGDGYELPKLKKMLIDAGLSGRVIFIGIVASGDKKDVYAAGDIFVYSSKSETQGMIISEAMYMGLPVVALKATGVKDMVEPQKTGLLVGEDEKEFSDAVSLLITDEDLRKKMAKNSAETASRKYTAAACAQKMLEIYEESIQRKNRERKF